MRRRLLRVGVIMLIANAVAYIIVTIPSFNPAVISQKLDGDWHKLILFEIAIIVILYCIYYLQDLKKKENK